jgi:uncharacterized membrane protein
MEAHLHTWLSLLARWAHVIAGVTWIGASFYFNWLENRLRRLGQPGDMTDDLWAVHGGGFYYLRKLAIAPEELPAQLNWYKRAAYATWITGVLMLILIYYWQAKVFMVDPGVAQIPARLAVLAGIATLLLSWLYYDVLCRSKLARNELVLGILILGWFAVVTWVLSHLLDGRAAYIHIGAAAGSIMVANVFHMISPAQKELVRAFAEGRSVDSRQGAMALQRSRHNSYFALPVLFIMISSHYPVVYEHALNWLTLLLIALVAVVARYCFNIWDQPGKRAWLLSLPVVLLGVAMYATFPRQLPPVAENAVNTASIARVREIIGQRCQQCHSAMPQFAGFTAAPRGIELDSREQVLMYAERMYEMTVISQTMPPENATLMTSEERQIIGAWYARLQHLLKRD